MGGAVRWRPLRNGFFSSYWILPSALTVSRSLQMAGLVTYWRGRLVKDALSGLADMVDKILRHSVKNRPDLR
jgi:hypothetical protein